MKVKYKCTVYHGAPKCVHTQHISQCMCSILILKLLHELDYFQQAKLVVLSIHFATFSLFSASHGFSFYCIACCNVLLRYYSWTLLFNNI